MTQLKDYFGELTWLEAHVKMIAKRHGKTPDDVCNDLIESVCTGCPAPGAEGPRL